VIWLILGYASAVIGLQWLLEYPLSQPVLVILVVVSLFVALREDFRG
jgi:hypothetical protein